MKSNPMDNPDYLRWAALIVGVIALIVGCRMSYKFGAAMSIEHGYGLMLLAIAGCIILPASGLFKSKALRNIGFLFLAIEFFSHIGYSVGTRVMNVEQTGVQNANYQLTQDSVGDEKELIASMKKRLAAMQEQNAWAASVTASALRAEIPAMDLAIEQETARGGCKAKCLKLTQDKAAIEAKIATTEQIENLTGQIAATQRVLDKKAEKAVTTEFKSSPVVAQTKFVSQIWTMSLDPDQGSITGTQIFIGILLAIATTFLAPSMFSVAFNALKIPSLTAMAPAGATAPYSTADSQVAALRDMVEKMQRRSATPAAAPGKHTEREIFLVPDDEFRSRLAEGARRLQAKAA